MNSLRNRILERLGQPKSVEANNAQNQQNIITSTSKTDENRIETSSQKREATNNTNTIKDSNNNKAIIFEPSTRKITETKRY